VLSLLSILVVFISRVLEEALCHCWLMMVYVRRGRLARGPVHGSNVKGLVRS
jgi:hypothetical protein